MSVNEAHLPSKRRAPEAAVATEQGLHSLLGFIYSPDLYQEFPLCQAGKRWSEAVICVFWTRVEGKAMFAGYSDIKVSPAR